MLTEEQAWSDVVREAQELVELALKAMLREVGVDPPKWHDVGPVLEEQAPLFPESTRAVLPELARISIWLRKEKEFSFCGDIDFIATEQYSEGDALRATQDAVRVLEAATNLIQGIDEAPASPDPR